VPRVDYKEQLSKDKKLARILGDTTHKLRRRKNIPLRLVQSIISQQLSTRVADVIFNRFLKLYDESEPTPQQILDTADTDLRAIGLSRAKTSYVKNVAAFCLEHRITDKTLSAMTDDAIIEKLVQIKGVGRWTVEMLLMFSLGREDVFAVDDLGIQQAMCKLYRISPDDKKEMKVIMLKHSAKWRPYRTYACLHLWRWKDSV
jgi:DNA-3-methyladenine glycosylase II